jgi:CDP-glycerol glycerophosphotransferase
MLYEDSPVMVRAHVLATSVDVLSPHVYYWRQRDSGELSITQRKAELSNLEDRMESVRQVHDFLHEKAPQLKPVYDRYALEVDLRVLVDSLLTANDAEQARIIELGHEFLDDVDPHVIGELTAAHRLCYHLLGRRMLPQLVELLRFEQTEKSRVQVVRRGRLRPRFFARYPFFEDPAVSVPSGVYDVTDELELESVIDDVIWENDRLCLEGHAMVKRLPMTSDTRLDVWLEHTKSKRRIDLNVQRVRRPDVTAESGQSAVSYDDSGFRVEIDPQRLKIGGAWKAADWRIHVKVRGNGLRHSGTITRQASGRASWTPMIEVAEGVRAQLVKAGSEPPALRIKRPAALVTGMRLNGDMAELTGWTSGTVAYCAVHITRRQGVTTVKVPADVRSDGADGTAFTARIPLAELAADLDLVDSVVNVSPLGEGIQWDVGLQVDGRSRKLALAEGARPVRSLFGSGEVTLTTTRFGNLTVLERSSRPVVEHVEWASDGRLLLSGTAMEHPHELILRHRRASEEYRCPVSWDGERFTTEIAPARVAKLGGRLPLATGNWAIFVADQTGGDVPVVIDRPRINGLTEPQTIGHHVFRLTTYQTDSLQLKVRAALPDDERGPYAQQVIQENDYLAYLQEPLRDLVVFDCYEGMQYSCSPRAIYEELQRRGTRLECVWVTKDEQFAVPGDGRTVLVGSREHYRALAQAKYVFGNYGQFPWFVKREGQVYVQTWHGTPLKKLAYDLRDMPFRRTETLDWMEREVPRWDVVISPNPFTTPIMRRAFRYEGEILESGYPRNDLLKSPDRDRIAAQVRRRLGVPEDKKVVLYAPTWRDDYHIARGKRGFSLQLDLAKAREALGDDHVFLVRTHYLINDRTWSQMDDFVIDVSSFPDIADLYLAADVLVTDYSSAMFDFAGTGKPMVFFTYDLERYRDHVRGFYFDFGAAAPGPLLQTSDEVIEAVRDVDAVHASHADAYAAFVAKFCPYDDGGAAGRVIDHVIGDA